MATTPISNKRFVAIGLMLFALFFGAGNLIFPASMGQASGENYVWAFLGFCLTGVGLPLLAVMSMGYSECANLQEAAGRVHPWYGIFYAVVVYLSIGPCFAIPRTGTVAFEIGVNPLISADPSVSLPIFLVIFFGITLWFSITPTKLVDRIGKVLTPLLVFALVCLIVASYITPLGEPAAAGKAYATAPTAVVQGVLDGYNTLDAVAAFVFAVLVVNFVREGGATDRKEVTSQIYKCGFIAVGILAVIYFFITKIGAESVAAIGMQETGAPVLAKSAQILFGNAGAAVLSIIVILACLTTAIGLITCCAAYFQRLTGLFTYKIWAVLFTVISFLIAMFGLKTIITSTVPVLMFVYPLAVALIVLLFTNNFFGGRQCVYVLTTVFTLVPAFINGLETAGIDLGAFEQFLQNNIPFWKLGIGWIWFAAAGYILGLIYKAAVPEKKAAAAA
ncbi:MAG: Branched-chain amino acid transport system carrier protein [Burkholderia sp.]|jgi:branched-chain amino acid:cation transporter, LIVCS family